MHALLASAYVWTQIVIPGATVLQAFGLNDKGQTAVALAIGTTGIYHDGTFTPLPPLPAGFSFTTATGSTGPTGINNAGVVCGGVFEPGGVELGFILSGSTYTFFFRPGTDTEARAISNAGLVTGFTFNGTSFAGFIYDPSTNTFTDATPPGAGPGAAFSTVQGMNKFGRITGDTRFLGQGRFAFVWQQGTIAVDERELLPFLDRIKIDGAGSAARGINDSGVIVGFTNSGKGFVGSDARGYQLLVPPGGEVAGNFTACEGINNHAQVVCFVNDAAGNPLGSFIGSPGED